MGDATGLFLGLLAAGVWGTQDVLVAFAGRRVGGIVSALGIVATSCAIILTLAVVQGVGPPTQPRVLATAVAAGAISAFGFSCFYTALRLGPVSVASPTVAVYGGLAALLAVIFLGESLVPAQAVGAAAATVGIALVGITVAAGSSLPRFRGPGVPFALAALVAWSVSTVMLATAIREVGWLSAAAAQRPTNVLVLVVMLVIVRSRGSPMEELPPLAPEPEPVIDVAATSATASRGARLSSILSAHPYRILVVGGTLESIGFVAFAYGLQVAPAWLVALASSLGPMVTVAAGIALFAERPRPIQWAGIALVFTGIALVAVS
jgi:drug/metabolite transporter (DMT)-like permease